MAIKPVLKFGHGLDRGTERLIILLTRPDKKNIRYNIKRKVKAQKRRKGGPYV